MLKNFGIALFLFTFSWNYLSAQNSPISGNWSGTLKFGNDSLRLVLVINYENDSLTAVLDSPDQYTTGLPVDNIRFFNDTLIFDALEYDVHYKGILQSDSSFKGKFTQYGRKKALNLHPHATRKFFIRPQEPQPPYPYIEKTINFATNPPTFGTLTLPTDATPRAVAILITGSGHQDRDETIMRHKPFKLIADTLTRCGYATYRYDDAAPAFFQNMTTFDFVEQVKDIIDSLSHIPELKNVKIGLIGHSEGALVACMTAAKRPDVAFVISLAGVAEPIKEILLYQNRVLSAYENIPQEQIEKNTAFTSAIYDVIIKAKSRKQAQKKLNHFLVEKVSTLTEEQKKASHLTPPEIAAIQRTLLSPWFYTLFHIDPVPFIRKVKAPFLALNGTLDLQVDALTNLPLFHNNLIRCNDHQTVTVKGVNHLFQECKTGLPQEYGDIDQTMSPHVLSLIIHWLDRHPF